MSNALRKISYLDENLLSEHERTRVHALEELATSLKGFASTEDRAAFSRLFSDAQAILELDDSELAGMLRVSRPTISRWARGESAPHSLGREPALRLLADLVDSRLKRHSADRNRYSGSI